MRTKLLLISCITLVLTLGIGCSKNNPLNPLGGCFGGGVWSENIITESNALVAAGQAYEDDPTEANCNNYKAAAEDYLNALKGVATCVPGLAKQNMIRKSKRLRPMLTKKGVIKSTSPKTIIGKNHEMKGKILIAMAFVLIGTSQTYAQSRKTKQTKVVLIVNEKSETVKSMELFVNFQKKKKM
ncbi:hypothetical protein [Maribacter halichondriae]|uniref:hypothetical protein n=1 Tax=Maribacter halichondriae TaxID=2980554 RepID=UPI002358926F|nr:hypothetical protein [Maribacter sp. Hal144]